MTCADFEVLLCDYLDGSLTAAQRTAVEEHQRQCVKCAEFAKDVAGAMAFMETASPVEPPPELLTKISFNIPQSVKKPNFLASIFGGWLAPIIQPRFAMGMAMTILSFSMLGKIGIEVRQLKPADLHPAKVWAAADDKAHRTWARAVKYYENLRLVYEVQTRLQEWTEQEEESRDNSAAPQQTQPKQQEGNRK